MDANATEGVSSADLEAVFEATYTCRDTRTTKWNNLHGGRRGYLVAKLRRKYKEESVSTDASPPFVPLRLAEVSFILVQGRPTGSMTVTLFAFIKRVLLINTGSVNETPHRKWREIDPQPSCWLQLALPGSCLVSLLFL